MDHVLETAVFDEIYFAECEAKLGVLDALFYECDKLDNIMKYSGNSNEFQIVQESFTKPAKNESTLTKVALAIPRFIYMMIKKIAEGFKKAFGKKNSFVTPQNVENASEIIKNLTGNEEFVKLACGAVVGAFATVKLFCKITYDKGKEKVDKKLGEYRENKAAKIASNAEFTEMKMRANDAIKDMVAIYVKEDGSTGLLIRTDMQKLFDGVQAQIDAAKELVHRVCQHAGNYTSKSEFRKNLDKLKYDIDHDSTIFRYLTPSIYPKDYTFGEYQAVMQKFCKANFTQEIEEGMNAITSIIGGAFKVFITNTNKAEKKTEQLEDNAQERYTQDINKMILDRIDFAKDWTIKLNDHVNTAVKEFNELIKSTAEKNTPYIGKDKAVESKMYAYEIDDWAADREEKDVKRKEASEKKKSENRKKAGLEEEPKEEKPDKTESSEEKKDNNKKEEKESDD